jgi:hypothetical protein
MHKPLEIVLFWKNRTGHAWEMIIRPTKCPVFTNDPTSADSERRLINYMKKRTAT